MPSRDQCRYEDGADARRRGREARHQAFPARRGIPACQHRSGQAGAKRGDRGCRKSARPEKRDCRTCRGGGGNNGPAGDRLAISSLPFFPALHIFPGHDPHGEKEDERDEIELRSLPRSKREKKKGGRQDRGNAASGTDRSYEQPGVKDDERQGKVLPDDVESARPASHGQGDGEEKGRNDTRAPPPPQIDRQKRKRYGGQRKQKDGEPADEHVQRGPASGDEPPREAVEIFHPDGGLLEDLQAFGVLRVDIEAGDRLSGGDHPRVAEMGRAFG